MEAKVPSARARGTNKRAKKQKKNSFSFVLPSNELGNTKNEAPNNRLALGCAEGLAIL